MVYDQEKEEIQEIKGLVYHKAADGRIISQIVEKKTNLTYRRKATAGKIDPTQTPPPTTN